MTRYYRRRRIYTRAPRRPTERIIRASTVNVPQQTTAIGYLYTANEPQTVTNFKLDTGITTSTAGPVAYVLVHIPEGYNANNINYPADTADLYNPTNNVLISGVLTDNTVEDHKFSRYSRKLKTGDRIALLYYNPLGSGGAIPVSFELNFTAVH